MTSMTQTAATLLVMGTVQGLFFAMLLIGAKRKHALPDRMLAGLLISLAAGYMTIFGSLMCLNPEHERFFRAMTPVMTASVPFLYMHVRSLVTPSFRLTAGDALHFIPTAAWVLYNLVAVMPVRCSAGIEEIVVPDHQSRVRAILAVYGLAYLPAFRRLTTIHALAIVDMYMVHPTMDGILMRELRVHTRIHGILAVCGMYWALNAVSLAFPVLPGLCPTFPAVSTAMIYLIGFIVFREPRAGPVMDGMLSGLEKTTRRNDTGDND